MVMVVEPPDATVVPPIVMVLLASARVALIVIEAVVEVWFPCSTQAYVVIEASKPAVVGLNPF
jgi:hypothetical protein